MIYDGRRVYHFILQLLLQKKNVLICCIGEMMKSIRSILSFVGCVAFCTDWEENTRQEMRHSTTINQ